MSTNNRRIAMYACENDRYCETRETFATVEDFLQMCRACFGEEPRLVERYEDGAKCWRDEHDEIALVEWPTTEIIEELRREAGVHGDPEMARICDAALAGNDEARRRCVEVIVEASWGVSDWRSNARNAGAP